MVKYHRIPTHGVKEDFAMSIRTTEAPEFGAGDLELPDPDKQPTVMVPVAGRILGISRNAAYEAAKRGEIPTIRLGGRVLVPTAALLEMLGRRVA